MQLQKRLFDFVESKRSWLTRLASEEAQRERATELRAQLLSSGFAWVNDAERLAPALITAWDSRRAAYCGAGPFGSPEELATHRAGCKFRPCPCPHGCMEVISAGRMAEHDAACGHKPLPCTQGCSAQVRRRDMATHVATSCERRPVECPFAYLGCAEPCTLGTRAAHLEASAPLHLSLLATATAALGRTVDAQLPIIAETAAQLRAGGGFNKQLGACEEKGTRHACVAEAQRPRSGGGCGRGRGNGACGGGGARGVKRGARAAQRAGRAAEHKGAHDIGCARTAPTDDATSRRRMSCGMRGTRRAN